jgi:hypothetical protein
LQTSSLRIAPLLAALVFFAGGCATVPVQRAPGVYMLAAVLPGAKVDVHSSPGGRVVARVGSTTEFGSRPVFWVVRQRGRWLGVTTPRTRGNRLGWIAYNPFKLSVYPTRWSVRASLSARRVDVIYNDRVVHSFAVTIGRAGSSTPAGRFSVTDALAGKGLGPYYGCCVLVLSGHQPNLPPGWLGGDRIAIHGTPGPVGAAASAGCLRAANRDLVYLFAKLPIGAPVTITE